MTVAKLARIYLLRDIDTLEVRYVGYTVKTLEDRLGRHIYTAQRYSTDITHRAQWLRARAGRISIELIEEVPLEEVEYAERKWIAALREAGCDLVNTTAGGRGRLGLTRGEAELAKMRATIAARGPQVFNEDVLKRISQKNTGKRRSDEAKAKMSAKKKGRPWTKAQWESHYKRFPKKINEPIPHPTSCSVCGAGEFRGTRGLYRHLERIHDIKQQGGTYAD